MKFERNRRQKIFLVQKNALTLTDCSRGNFKLLKLQSLRIDYLVEIERTFEENQKFTLRKNSY